MSIKTLSFFILCFGCSHSLFVPEQLTTLLSFVYTNIPPIRKGTDSRVGFGFRLGPNADFQVMFELGPQENTQPLGPQSNNKRETYAEEEFKDWEEKLQFPVEEQKETGPTPNLDQDIINHLKQLYKPQKEKKKNVTDQ